MQKTLVLLVSGKARSGKDTLAEFLNDYISVNRIGFADKLKETVADLYGFSDEQMYGDLKDAEDPRYPNHRDKEFIPTPKLFDGGFRIEQIPNPDYRPFLTPRRVLQLFGQDQRSIDPNIWANYVFRKITERSQSGIDYFVVPDLRFPNEYDVAKKWETATPDSRKVVAVKITRESRGIVSGSNDISETSMDNFQHWDFVLENNGTKADLYELYCRKMLELDLKNV